ncbi:MAG TPA: AAA family ATPase, partial [Nocardioides sp.]|nr:AAA family ATPase [Nocardioides sp.]
MAGSVTAGHRPERQWPLTGRDQELTRTLDALGAGARIVVVHGSAGVGRSRYLAEVARRCADRGEHVVELAGSAILSSVPLGVLSSHLADLAVYDGASADPARLFADAGARLTAGSPGHRVVLAVDDVSLLDATSVLLVAQLAAAGRARLVATLRQGDPLPEPLVAAWSATRDHRLDLAPLDPAAVHALLEGVLEGTVAQRAASALHERSGGNPLYLRELVLGALGDGSLAQAAGLWQLTGTPTATPALRDLVLGRLAPLDAASRDVLDRLAVCGALRPDQLPGDGVRRTLASLEEIGLVELRGRTAVLAEPVHGTVLVQTMSRLRVEDLLTEQAALLAERAGGSPDDLQVTMWQLEAGVPARPDVVAAAARYAAETGDRASVIRLTDAGLRSAPDDPALLLLHAEAALRLGRAEDALAALARHPATEDPGGAAVADAVTVAAVGRATAQAHLHRLDPRAAVAVV